MTGNKTRVVIVDDTRSIRAMIRALLMRSGDIEVVGEAGDPYEARELIRTLNPDVITLDVVMPRMDGLSFLEKVMRLRPMPVVMVSTRTTEKSFDAVRALELGAVDCVDLRSLQDGTSKVNLADAVLMAAQSNTSHFARKKSVEPPQDTSPFRWNGKTVLIGSSTGGVEALMTILSSYPVDGPPTVIAQHMPSAFLSSFADRLDRSIAPKTLLAEDGQRVEKGHVYLAPGGTEHLILSPKRPPVLQFVPDAGEAYVPSIDLLMASGERHGRKVVGVILTGMGRDGADSLLKMRQAGAHTIVQSAKTCVVDGMPGAARKIGAAVEVAPLDLIG
ncbi:MAG: chemotaxis-specific protein-glutamate methyltransferase CheB, partial [Silicimonas sp.]|nr:chemotaxis-specific protein-glutamate methyltransferase CheB [Silicimonas sp.]